MFYERFLELCDRKGVKPTRVAIDAGFSKSLVSKWKANEAKEPSPDVIRKLADYFGISVYEVLEDAPTKKAPTLTQKDERDVARDVERIMGNLENSGELMFDGVPMSEEAKAAMAAAMRVGLEEAKRRNKATYTPKQYRKE